MLSMGLASPVSKCVHPYTHKPTLTLQTHRGQSVPPTTRTTAIRLLREAPRRKVRTLLISVCGTTNTPQLTQCQGRNDVTARRLLSVQSCTRHWCVLTLRLRPLRVDARTDLISPQDLLEAAQLTSPLNLPIALRRFPSGVLVLQLASQSDDALSARTRMTPTDTYIAYRLRLTLNLPRHLALTNAPSLGALAEKHGHLTALDVARLNSVSLSLAKDQLLLAETRGFLCRDDSAEVRIRVSGVPATHGFSAGSCILPQSVPVAACALVIIAGPYVVLAVESPEPRLTPPWARFAVAGFG